MKARLITGLVYVLVLIAFFALKITINNIFFDVLILAFAAIGTFEMIRAFGGKMCKSQKIIVMVFAILIVGVYAVSDFVYQDLQGATHLIDWSSFLPDATIESIPRNYAPHITFVAFLAGIAVLLGLMVFQHEEVTLESTGYSLLSYIYPSVFLVVMTVCNHLEKYSNLAIAIIFIISPVADSFAFVFGRLFGKKLPAKLAPNVSPNKTLIGGFGGLVGGAIGGVALFFFYYGLCEPIYLWKTQEIAISAAFAQINFKWLDMIFFCSLGVVVSAFSQFGDLVESAIKRKFEIKDMGKILPGHGGVLDRIDSSLYASLIVALVLVVRLMSFG